MSRRWSGSGSGGGAAAQESKELLLLRQEVEVRWARSTYRRPDPCSLYPSHNSHTYPMYTCAQRLRALVPPARRLPKLLVLDLNGFLVHRVFMGGDGERMHACMYSRACLPVAACIHPPRLTPLFTHPEDKGALPRVASNWTLNGFVVYERPHARDFLRCAAGLGGNTLHACIRHDTRLKPHQQVLPRQLLRGRVDDRVGPQRHALDGGPAGPGACVVKYRRLLHLYMTDSRTRSGTPTGGHGQARLHLGRQEVRERSIVVDDACTCRRPCLTSIHVLAQVHVQRADGPAQAGEAHRLQG